MLLQVRKDLPHLKAIVQYKGKLSEQYPDVYDVSSIHITIALLWSISHTQWEQFLELGTSIDDSVVEKKISEQKPEDCASLIYTVS